jgi:hypothetical protein
MTFRLLAMPMFALLVAAGCDTDPDDDDTGDDDAVEWPTSFDGTVTLQSTLGGELLCDAEIALTGARYDGVCPDCDYAFSVEANVLVDNGTVECWHDPLLSYLPGDGIDDLVLAHAPSFGVLEWYGMYYYADALVTGYTAYGEGPYWWVLSHEKSSEGTYERSGDDIDWTWEYQAFVDVDPHFQDCGDVGGSDADTGFPGSTSATGELACDGTVADVYQFTADAGQTVFITVDTVAEATAYDPALYVNGPDGCTLVEVDDSFDCTWPPPAYRCPAVELETGAGDHLIVVTSRGNCAGEVGEYELRFDGANPALLALEDDVPISAELVVDVVGSGTLTP